MRSFYSCMVWATGFELAIARHYSSNREYIADLSRCLSEWEGLLTKEEMQWHKITQYRQLMIQGKDGWYLVNPGNLWEALRLAWMLWRYPDRVGALVGLGQEAQEFVIGGNLRKPGSAHRGVLETGICPPAPPIPTRPCVSCGEPTNETQSVHGVMHQRCYEQRGSRPDVQPAVESPKGSAFVMEDKGYYASIFFPS